MGENKGFKIAAIVALCVAVAGLSVAYAALTQSLNVTTNGSVAGLDTVWKVRLNAGTCSVVTGNSSSTAAGTITGSDATTVTISGVVLGAPGDKVECTFTANNTGSTNASLTSITTAGLDATATTSGTQTVSWGSGTTAGSAAVNFALLDSTTSDGTYAAATASGVTLAKTSGVRYYKVTLQLDSSANALPATAEALDPITTTFVFDQA